MRINLRTIDNERGRWQWSLAVDWIVDHLMISLDLLAVSLPGRPDINHPVGYLGIRFIFNPRNWKIKTVHMYYDGPCCDYQLGPIAFTRVGIGWCQKCLPDDYDSAA